MTSRLLSCRCLALLALSAAAAPLIAAPPSVAGPPSADPHALFDAAEAQRIEVLDGAAEAVVCIFADRAAEGGGSGVLIDPAGYGLTNFHVVQEFVESRRGYGGLRDGRLYRLRLIGVDPGGDVALFRLEGRERFPVAPLGDSDSLAVGQPVAAVGNPFVLAEDFHPSVSLGIVSGLHRYQEGQGNLLEYADCIQFSSSINPGNSGGPLFALDGHVVGINGRASFEERGRVNVGLGYAISINQIRRFLPGLYAGRLVEHGTLGMQVRDSAEGVVVRAIQDFSAADNAGIRLGDRLLRLADRPIRTANDFTNVINTFPAGWPLTLDLLRRDEPVRVTARLDRLGFGQPIVYPVDYGQNQRAARDLLLRARRALAPDWPAGASLRVAPAAGDSADAPGATVVAAGLPTAGGLAALSAAAPRPADEWRFLLRALLAAVDDAEELTLDWELLGGDEVHGRLAGALRFRPRDLPDAAVVHEVHWLIDWWSGAPLAVRFLAADGASFATWRPADPGLLTPHDTMRWVRVAAGDETTYAWRLLPPAEPELDTPLSTQPADARLPAPEPAARPAATRPAEEGPG